VEFIWEKGVGYGRLRRPWCAFCKGFDDCGRGGCACGVPRGGSWHGRKGIQSSGGQCIIVKLDVADSSSIAALSNKIEQLDILVNNAGITREGAVLDQSEADWDNVIETNLKGMFLMAQTAAKAMRDNKQGGSIINIASILGLRPDQWGIAVRSL